MFAVENGSKVFEIFCFGLRENSDSESRGLSDCSRIRSFVTGSIKEFNFVYLFLVFLYTSSIN